MELRNGLIVAGLGALVGTGIAYGTEPIADGIQDLLKRDKVPSELREAASYAHQSGDSNNALALETYIADVYGQNSR